MSELTPQERLVRVLGLIEADYKVHTGDTPWRPFSAEAAAFDYVTYIKIQGAMRAGEIPSPAGDPLVWIEFMATHCERAKVSE